MELLIAVDALKRASADEVTVIMPYYGYARQDRKAKARQPITARLVADMLNVAGVDRVVTFDLHAAQIQGFFKCPVDDMSAIPLFSYYFRNLNLNKDIVVVSPDHGGVTRARRFGDLLSAPIAIMDKRRPKPNVAEVTSVIGDVKGKIAIMVDDIVDTAGTLTAGAKKLIDEGALQVFAACTHAVLSGSAIENIESSVIEELIVSNTIELNNNKKISKIKVLSVGPMLAKIIEQIEKGLPLSNVYNLYQKF